MPLRKVPTFSATLAATLVLLSETGLVVRSTTSRVLTDPEADPEAGIPIVLVSVQFVDWIQSVPLRYSS